MARLLHIDSSILAEQSLSRRLTADVVARLRQELPGLDVVYRDLAAEPAPQLTGAYFAARAAQETPADAKLRDDLALGRKLLEEFLSADIVVVGAPMYNFSVPAQLRAWVDHIIVPGATFRYTPTGIEGLAGGKRVIVASTRGGVFSETGPRAGHEHQESYLRAVFANIGLPEIEIVRAEGVALGEDARNAAIEAARRNISALKAA